MNEGQQKFLSFILERTQEGKKAEVQAILEENFRKQAEGTFGKEDVMAFMPKMMALLKPECTEEVQMIVKQFGSQQK